MNTIDEIMGAIGRHGDDCIRDADAASASFEALREMIAAALEDARRDGAAEAQQRMFPCCGGSDESPADHTMDCPDAPAGERQAVLLTDAEVRQIGDATLYVGGIYDRVRAIETAVLAVNGLEVRHG